MRVLSITLFLSIFFIKNTKGQLTTTQTLTPQQLVQNVLLGGGVTASNITYTGDPLQISKFTAPASTNLGIQSGILISTGNASTSSPNGPQGPNNNTGTSTAFNGPGDSYLSTLSSQATFDAGVLEFDFVASGDTVKFRYVFASEEYPEFVGSINDAFALILSGAGSTVLAPTNIAIIPTTTSGSNVVSINNINATTNTMYYINNASSFVNTEFDGLTKVLTAKYKVNCGQQYHIKIAIADGSDAQLDSGVFLEEGSFSSLPPLTLNTTNLNSSVPDTLLVEDCNSNCINFIRNGNIANADSFNLQVSGNALLGTDYTQAGNPTFAWPTKLYFAANQDTIKICNITALQDNITENADTIKFTMSSFTTSTVSCLSNNSIKFNLYIRDYTPITIGQNDISICSGTSVLLNAAASNGYPSYTYTISAPTVNTATLNTGPINSTTNYSITVNDVCNKPITKQITVTPVSIPTVSVNDTILCSGNSGILHASGATTYSWSTGATSSSISISPSSSTNYTVVGFAGTCTNSAVSSVTVIGQALLVTGNSNICSGQSSTLTVSGGSLYTWSDGTTSPNIVVTPTITSTYTVISVASTCTNSSVYTITVTPIPTISVNDATICPGQNATLTATGATNYIWSTGATGSSINVNPVTNTTYTVIGTVSPSCTNTAICTASIITSKPTLQISGPVVFCLDSVKQIPLIIQNGNPPYNVAWMIPAGGIVPFDTVNHVYYFTQSVSASSENYTITVTDQCLYHDTVTVEISSVDCDILVPNVVTPNGDGVNDYFKIRGIENFPGSSLVVFNR